MKTHKLGTIVLDENTRVTDPGYDSEMKLSFFTRILLNTLPGHYKCTAFEMEKGYWRGRIIGLRITHINEIVEEKNRRTRMTHEGSFNVDSGQAGFFKEEYFKKNSKSDEWYNKICSTTNSDRQSGCVDNACTTCTAGRGDGMYDCYVHRNASGYITIAELRFR